MTTGVRVSMMDIGDMRMLVSDRVMSVRMRMGFGHRTLVGMLVVLFTRMQMVVLQRFVRVEVAVPFAKKQHYAGDHQDRRDDFYWTWDRPKNSN